jgi:hypothetical protein
MQLPDANPDVIYKPVADGAVLLDTRSEVYFGLNPVGARIWALLPPACTHLDDLCAALSREYPDAAEDTLRADVMELFNDLIAHGLLAARNETVAAVETATH